MIEVMPSPQELQANLKKIGPIRDAREFFFQFLLAYGIPRATLDRILMKTVREGTGAIDISNKIHYSYSPQSNLYTPFDSLKRDGLCKIKSRFIFLANDSSILAFDSKTEETLACRKEELYLHFAFFFPLIGREKEGNLAAESVDIKVAEKFAQLYNELLVNNADSPNIESGIDELMSRLLFCFFADSVGIIDKGSVHRVVADCSNESGDDLARLLCQVFGAMAVESRKGLPLGLADIDFVDTTLFCNSLSMPHFTRKARELVLDIGRLDWSDVNPDVLGALIQSVVFPGNSGTNYNFTSEANIHKLIGPLFVDKLYDAFERDREDRAECLALLKRIREIKVFDPACRTGNFLIVAYRELKLLESLIVDTLGGNVASSGSGHSVSIAQFYGIDDSAFACEMAKLGLFFTECQLLLKRGEGLGAARGALHLINQSNIIRGNATRINWSNVCPNQEAEVYIVGNPPYKGARKQTKEQRSDVAAVFRQHEKSGDLDYAACWFYLAAEYIRGSKNAFAFVTTNSLTQGQQVGLLWPRLFEKGIRIFFAHTAFKWKNEARNNTAVTVVIVGMNSDSCDLKSTLFTPTNTYEVSWINPYLTSGKIIVYGRVRPISALPCMAKGNMPYDNGHLLLSPDDKQSLIEQFPMARRFVKRVVGSEEFINGIERWCIWIEERDLDEALAIPPIRNRVNKVRDYRLSRKDSAAQKLAGKPYRFRENNTTTKLSLVVPSVSSERRTYIPIGFVGEDTIVTNLAFVIYDCESWLFGVIASKMHNLWIRTVCGGLETRLRYSSELGYNTFPFPNIPDDQRARIRECVYDILKQRETQAEKTLAQKYDPDTMSEGLSYAHAILDAAIDSCYREEPFTSDQERLEYLFQLYSEMGGEDDRQHH